MKKIILLIAFFSFGCYAQTESDSTRTSIFNRKHEVKIGAIKLLAGPILEGTYEYIQTKDFTYGASALVNFNTDNDYPEDFSVTPFARFYFQESKEYGAKGFFVEGFGKYILGHTYENFWDNEERKSYSTASIGLSLGKKWINRTGFVFEILIGVGRNIGGNSYTPDASFRGDLNIGYRF